MANRVPRWVLVLVALFMLSQAALFVGIFALMGGVGWWAWKNLPGEEVAAVDLASSPDALSWRASATAEQTLWLFYDLSDCTLEGEVDGKSVFIQDGNPRVDGAVHARYLGTDQHPRYGGHVRITDYPPGEGERSSSGSLACSDGGSIVELRLYATNQR